MNDVSRPEFVIFDMDDVLCKYELGKRLRFLAQLADTTARDVRSAIWDSGFEDAADSGTYPNADDYLKEFGQRLGYPITKDEWVHARREAMTTNEEVLDIALIISKQADIAIYTNNGPVVKENLDALLPDVAAVFSQRFCSYEFDTKKPDPKSFSRLAAKLNRAPATCWFIDDKKSNVEGARIAGMIGHHFRGVDLLTAEAKNLGFKL